MILSSFKSLKKELSPDLTSVVMIDYCKDQNFFRWLLAGYPGSLFYIFCRIIALLFACDYDIYIYMYYHILLISPDLYPSYMQLQWKSDCGSWDPSSRRNRKRPSNTCRVELQVVSYFHVSTWDDRKCVELVRLWILDFPESDSYSNP